jgi:hypothetical protein
VVLVERLVGRNGDLGPDAASLKIGTNKSSGTIDFCFVFQQLQQQQQQQQLLLLLLLLSRGGGGGGVVVVVEHLRSGLPTKIQWNLGSRI